MTQQNRTRHRQRRMPRVPCNTVLASVLALAVGGAGMAQAETRPSLNFYGATGLIDMPSGEAQPDGQLSVSTAHFGPVSRTTLSFQITPRISASFRFLGIRDWNANVAPASRVGIDAFDTYYDRSFDLRFKVLDESRYLPAVTIGLQDFAGTGVLAGEYVAATKNITPSLKVTAGLGWGRLGSHGGIGSPFGARPPIAIGFGGKFNTSQWFRGPAAPFGGVEWKISDAWTFKGEYSSDNYDEEARRRGTFDRKSPVNLGLEYHPGDSYRLGLYYMHGSQIGLAGHFVLNPRTPRNRAENAPAPVRPRPPRNVDPGAWDGGWVTQADAGPVLRGNIERRLADDGIFVESLDYSANRVRVGIRNDRLDNEAQAIGRTARVLSQTMPASVETFEIVPVVSGMPASTVTLRRSDLERLEFSPDATRAMRGLASIASADRVLPGTFRDPELYPAFRWSLGPYARFRFFDQRDPFKMDVGLRLTGRYDIAPGLHIAGEVTQRLAGNLKDRPPLPDRRRLQPVRSAVYYYDRDGTTALEKLALHWNTKLGRDVYGRVSAGYLERMFGGVSTEVLWKPAGSRWAFGAELNYVRQRSPKQNLGFTLPASMYQTDNFNGGGPAKYSVLTGHVSAYYQISDGFHVQLDVGRYLAGDVGATLSIDREFANGWRVGAFATKTNVSAADFGSGSFDKGIRIEVPFAWLMGKPTRRSTTTVLRPFGRDGGARLEVDGRLYNELRSYHAPKLDGSFGGFWK